MRRLGRGAAGGEAPVQDDQNDAALVARAKRDRAAFESLYRRYADPANHYSYRRLGDHDVAAARLIAPVLRPGLTVEELAIGNLDRLPGQAKTAVGRAVLGGQTELPEHPVEGLEMIAVEAGSGDLTITGQARVLPATGAAPIVLGAKTANDTSTSIRLAGGGSVSSSFGALLAFRPVGTAATVLIVTIQS